MPGAGWDKRQLIRATASDIRELAERSTERLDSWFGGRMGDRLLRLARHEQTRSREQEARRSGETANGQPDAAQEQVLGMPLLTLGLTGMDIGRGIGFVRRELGNDAAPPVQHALRELIHALADDYQRCARGRAQPECARPAIDYAK